MSHPGRALHDKLETLVDGANAVYKPLLVRKAETDQIRQTLAVQKRFNFLFSIPGNMSHNIQVSFRSVTYLTA